MLLAWNVRVFVYNSSSHCSAIVLTDRWRRKTDRASFLHVERKWNVRTRSTAAWCNFTVLLHSVAYAEFFEFHSKGRPAACIMFFSNFKHQFLVISLLIIAIAVQRIWTTLRQSDLRKSNLYGKRKEKKEKLMIPSDNKINNSNDEINISRATDSKIS